MSDSGLPSTPPAPSAAALSATVREGIDCYRRAGVERDRLVVDDARRALDALLARCEEAEREVVLANFDGHLARAEAAEAERDEAKQRLATFLRDMDIPVVKGGMTYAELAEALRAADAERAEAGAEVMALATELAEERTLHQQTLSRVAELDQALRRIVHREPVALVEAGSECATLQRIARAALITATGNTVPPSVPPDCTPASKRESLTAARSIAEQYASDPTFKADVDRALGVFHLPPHRPGVCGGCDAARAKGQIKDSEWEGRLRD